MQRGARVPVGCRDARVTVRAAAEGYVPLLIQLLRAGAELHECDADGETPLTAACAHGRYFVVRLLLQWGADPNLCNAAGLHPLECAALACEAACEHVEEAAYRRVELLLRNAGAVLPEPLPRVSVDAVPVEDVVEETSVDATVVGGTLGKEDGGKECGERLCGCRCGEEDLKCDRHETSDQLPNTRAEPSPPNDASPLTSDATPLASSGSTQPASPFTQPASPSALLASLTASLQHTNALMAARVGVEYPAIAASTPASSAYPDATHKNSAYPDATPAQIPGHGAPEPASDTAVLNFSQTAASMTALVPASQTPTSAAPMPAVSASAASAISASVGTTSPAAAGVLTVSSPGKTPSKSAFKLSSNLTLSFASLGLGSIPLPPINQSPNHATARVCAATLCKLSPLYAAVLRLLPVLGTNTAAAAADRGFPKLDEDVIGASVAVYYSAFGDTAMGAIHSLDADAKSARFEASDQIQAITTGHSANTAVLPNPALLDGNHTTVAEAAANGEAAAGILSGSLVFNNLISSLVGMTIGGGCDRAMDHRYREALSEHSSRVFLAYIVYIAMAVMRKGDVISILPGIPEKSRFAAKNKVSGSPIPAHDFCDIIPPEYLASTLRDPMNVLGLLLATSAAVISLSVLQCRENVNTDVRKVFLSLTSFFKQLLPTTGPYAAATHHITRVLHLLFPEDAVNALMGAGYADDAAQQENLTKNSQGKAKPEDVAFRTPLLTQVSTDVLIILLASMFPICWIHFQDMVRKLDAPLFTRIFADHLVNRTPDKPPSEAVYINALKNAILARSKLPLEPLPPPDSTTMAVRCAPDDGAATFPVRGPNAAPAAGGSVPVVVLRANSASKGTTNAQSTGVAARSVSPASSPGTTSPPFHINGCPAPLNTSVSTKAMATQAKPQQLAPKPSSPQLFPASHRPFPALPPGPSPQTHIPRSNSNAFRHTPSVGPTSSAAAPAQPASSRHCSLDAFLASRQSSSASSRGAGAMSSAAQTLSMGVDLGRLARLMSSLEGMGYVRTPKSVSAPSVALNLINPRPTIGSKNYNPNNPTRNSPATGVSAFTLNTIYSSPCSLDAPVHSQHHTRAKTSSALPLRFAKKPQTQRFVPADVARGVNAAALALAAAAGDHASRVSVGAGATAGATVGGSSSASAGNGGAPSLRPKSSEETSYNSDVTYDRQPVAAQPQAVPSSLASTLASPSVHNKSASATHVNSENTSGVPLGGMFTANTRAANSLLSAHPHDATAKAVGLSK